MTNAGLLQEETAEVPQSRQTNAPSSKKLKETHGSEEKQQYRTPALFEGIVAPGIGAN